jgi:hypothetical protein
MTTATRPFTDQDTAHDLADRFVQFLETNQAPDGLFAETAFMDLTLPRWRLQAQGRAGLVASRQDLHPATGRIRPVRLDLTPTGFVLEIEERWSEGGEDWYCRELFRCDVEDGSITDLTIYCTGDWDRARVAEHAAAVTLIRP